MYHIMNKQELKEIVIDQSKRRIGEDLIDRDIYDKAEETIKNKFIIIISGIRRSGKSTLLNQLREKYLGYYLNFDDDRLVHFKIEDFQILYEIFLELFGERDYFYFDEIQNIEGWERFVRRLHDENLKIFVTGSNASMLSRELGTHLTGRHLEIPIYPFSFLEYLKFKNIELEKNWQYNTHKRVEIKKAFNEYLYLGGFPEYLHSKNKEYLKTLYENILYRDILVHYNLSNEKALKELVYYSASNVSKEISFNRMKKMIGLGSSTTVKEYFAYLENSYLVFLLPKFEYSLKKQIFANKKIYFIDNALALNLGFRISDDKGRLLENLVFTELKRRKNEVYYFSEKGECDFVIKEGNKIIKAIQVCHDFNKDNEKREINGLLESLKKFKLKKGIILTNDQEEEIKIENRLVKIVPVWKFLLEKDF